MPLFEVWELRLLLGHVQSCGCLSVVVWQWRQGWIIEGDLQGKRIFVHADDLQKSTQSSEPSEVKEPSTDPNQPAKSPKKEPKKQKLKQPKLNLVPT